jgi:hypothetical protein
MDRSYPLWAHFPSLFAIAAEPEASVAHSWRGGDWVIPFRQTLSRGERLDWEEMRRMLVGANLPSRADKLTWTLERSGKFTVSSLYHKLCQGTASSGGLPSRSRSKCSCGSLCLNAYPLMETSSSDTAPLMGDV